MNDVSGPIRLEDLAIRLHEDDDVAVAKAEIPSGTDLHADSGTIAARNAIAKVRICSGLRSRSLASSSGSPSSLATAAAARLLVRGSPASPVESLRGVSAMPWAR